MHRRSWRDYAGGLAASQKGRSVRGERSGLWGPVRRLSQRITLDPILVLPVTLGPLYMLFWNLLQFSAIVEVAARFAGRDGVRRELRHGRGHFRVLSVRRASPFVAV